MDGRTTTRNRFSRNNRVTPSEGFARLTVVRPFPSFPSLRSSVRGCGSRTNPPKRLATVWRQEVVVLRHTKFSMPFSPNARWSSYICERLERNGILCTTSRGVYVLKTKVSSSSRRLGKMQIQKVRNINLAFSSRRTFVQNSTQHSFPLLGSVGILVPGGYIPTLETKQRECWKF